ncbi:MAG TPA: CPBP family intramembrane metalloprotease domain-containing protein [Anaerolineaceae bacterium]|nr:MAG: CAAX amino terminal protease family [Anaerolineaceae bacterium 46_22]HAF48612.1 CPBP family intramembrane metalloprotease domain-containing protein [Anaerolineaceae bacterium]
MITGTNKKRIYTFLAFAFGISWAVALVIYLTGGLQNSPSYTFSGGQVTLAIILLASVYMFGPAIANLLTRIITKEGKKDLFLQPNFDQKRGLYFLAAWFLPGLLTITGAILFFLLFPQFYDKNLSTFQSMLAASGQNSSINPWIVAVMQALQALFISPILNAISTFGEEFGWRAYLQPKLMPLGGRKAVLLTGLIWGVWHWPIIFMGYNYGSDYFGAPFLGPLAMVWFTLGLSVIFGWLSIKAHSLWPAVIAHGAINGIAALGSIFVKGNPDSLLGPTPVGIVSGFGLTFIAVLILIHPTALKPEKQ